MLNTKNVADDDFFWNFLRRKSLPSDSLINSLLKRKLQVLGHWLHIHDSKLDFLSFERYL